MYNGVVEPREVARLLSSRVTVKGKWVRLARMLSIEEYRVSELRFNHNLFWGDQEDLLYEILVEWRTKFDKGATYSALCRALEGIKEMQASAELGDYCKEKFLASFTSNSTLCEKPSFKCEFPGLQIERTELVGKGAYSEVFSAKVDGFDRAIKIASKSQFEFCDRELEIWKQLSEGEHLLNVNIVRLHFYKSKQVEIIGEVCMFFMELAKNDLYKEIALSQSENYSMMTYRLSMRNFLHDAAKGLSWLHDQNPPIVHRDIKPQNILIFKYQSAYHAKIGDFGLSRKITCKDIGELSNARGTVEWMAPEAIRAFILKETLHTLPSLDIFSLGVTFQFAYSGGEHPFEDFAGSYNYRDYAHNIRHSKPVRLEQSEWMANHLFQWMMTQESQLKRPSIKHVLEHPFFYSSEKILQFLVFVGITFDSRDNDIVQLKSGIDGNYKTRYPGFDWKEKMGDGIFSTLTKNRQKQYEVDSITSFVKLIRDKHSHHPEIEFGALRDIFPDGSYSESAFAEYILKIAPDIVFFLFNELRKINHTCLDSIRNNEMFKFNLFCKSAESKSPKGTDK